MKRDRHARGRGGVHKRLSVLALLLASTVPVLPASTARAEDSNCERQPASRAANPCAPPRPGAPSNPCAPAKKKCPPPGQKSPANPCAPAQSGKPAKPANPCAPASGKQP